MAKRKWYVITVGKDVGVFATWLEAGPLVKGVPEAIYQSFWTEQEANRIFAQEYAKGNTRIIQGDNKGLDRRTTEETFNRNAVYLEGTRSLTSVDSSLTGPSRRSKDANNFLSYNIPQAPSTHASETPHNSVHSSSAQSAQPIVRSASESSSKVRRFEVVNALFEKEAISVGVEVRASHPRHASASTPMSDVMRPVRSSTSKANEPACPRVVVKTPSWLASYPKASSPSSGPLSPLSDTDLPFNRFKDQLTEQTFTLKTTLPSATGTPYASESSIHLSPSVRPPTITYQSNVDPRSPITQQTKIPELTFISPLSFTRPSPSTEMKELSHAARNAPPKSSLLLRPHDANLSE